MDAAHWHQIYASDESPSPLSSIGFKGLGLVKPMEDMLMAANPSQPGSTTAPNTPAPAAALRGGGGAPPAVGGAGSTTTERRVRPQKEKALNCPRCNSTNTKFCYYNNYSLQQPRYFCKTCRRYWTEGGSLRNVPVGGGSRKNKRSSSAASSVSASVTTSMAAAAGSLASPSNKNPKLMTPHHEGGAHDLNLAFPHHHHGGSSVLHPGGEFAAAFPSLESSSVGNSNGRGGGGGAVGALSAMELLRSTGCYMPLQVPAMQMPGDYAAAAGFSFGEFRTPPPAQSVLGFSLDAHASAPGAAAGYGSGGAAGLHGENTSRLLFPFEDLKPPVSSAAGAGGGDGAGASGGGAGDGNRGHHQFEHGKEQAGGGGAGGGAGHDTPGAFWNGMIGGSGTTW